MSTQGTIMRYILITEKITSVKHPSFQVLKAFLHDHGFEISQRTLQRDVEQIRFEFDVDIKYNRSENGYFIDKTNSFHLDTFLRFLEISGTANLITDSLKEGKNTLNYLSFESEGNLKGIENLKSLLFAVKNHRNISFEHLNFETGKSKTHNIQPYLLKEYQNRWYVIGFVNSLKEFRTFGVDRIGDLKVLSEKFIPDKKSNVKQRFENIIGLFYSNDEPEEIILSFTALQAKYIKTLPLHKSQEIINEKKEEVLVRFFLQPNYEFIQKILMLGDQVKVVKPLSLVNEVKDVLTSTLNNYRK